MNELIVDVEAGQVSVFVAQNVNDQRKDDQKPGQAMQDLNNRIHKFDVVVDAFCPRLSFVGHPKLTVVLLLLLGITQNLRVPNDAIRLRVNSCFRCFHDDSTHCDDQVGYPGPRVQGPKQSLISLL